MVIDPFEAGDAGYAPMGAGHYIKNSGASVLRVLVGFNNGHYEANDLSARIGLNPLDVLATNLGVSHEVAPNCRVASISLSRGDARLGRSIDGVGFRRAREASLAMPKGAIRSNADGAFRSWVRTKYGPLAVCHWRRLRGRGEAHPFRMIRQRPGNLTQSTNRRLMLWAFTVLG